MTDDAREPSGGEARRSPRPKSGSAGEPREDADPPTGGDAPTDPDAELNRRAFLGAVGATGAAAGVAGCSDLTSYEFAATPVVLGEDALAALAATARDAGPVTNEYVRSVRGVRTTVTVESHLAVYETGRREGAVTFGDGTSGRVPETNENTGAEYRAGAGASGPVGARDLLGAPTTVGVLATPAASVAGRPVNPLATASARDLVASDRGRAVLAEAGLDPDAEVLRAFEPAGAVTPSNIAGAVSPSDVAGAVTPSDLERFVGVVREASGDRSLVVATVGRDEVEGDVVVAVGVQRLPLADDADLANRPLVGDDDGLVAPGALDAGAAQLAAVVPLLVPEGGTLPFDPAAVAVGPGEVVSDGDDATPDLGVVVAALDVPVADWVVFDDETVASQNPDYDPTEPVVVVAYEHLLDAGWNGWREADGGSLFDGVVERGVKFHAFPRSRLSRHLVAHSAVRDDGPL